MLLGPLGAVAVSVAVAVAVSITVTITVTVALVGTVGTRALRSIYRLGHDET